MIGYVAARQNTVLPNRKTAEIPGRPRSPDSAWAKRDAVGSQLQSGYALPTLRANGILILIDAKVST
jgi:hypothetical protein